MIDEPAHPGSGQLWPIGVLGEAGKAACEIRGRIHQQLVAQRHWCKVPDDDGQVGAGGVATDGKPIGRAAKRCSVGVSPTGRCDSVVEGGRELMLRSQPIVDAQHGLIAAVGEDATDVVMRVEIADHPSAAVEEDQQAEVVAVVRSVQANGHAVCVEIASVMDRLGRRARCAWRGSRAPARRCTLRGAARRERPPGREVIPLGDAGARVDSGTAGPCSNRPSAVAVTVIAMTDDITRYDAVEGYCGALSYAPGESMTLHVSSSVYLYDVSISRWGVEHEPVWSDRDIPGVEQVLPADADANGCGWPVALTVPVDETWRSGFYLVTLTAHDAPPDRAVGYAGFVVRAGKTRARALLVLATNTYNAYNSWGGKSLYTGGSRVSFARPFGRGMLMRPSTERDDRKARPTYRREEPDVDGLIYQHYRFANGYPGFMGSAGWFTYERRFVEWAEDHAFEFDYAVSGDLERDPDDRRRLRPRDGSRPRRILVSGSAGRDRGARSRWRQLHEPVGQHDVLAGSPGGRRSGDGLPQVQGTRSRPRGRHGCAGDDDGNVGRSTDRST